MLSHFNPEPSSCQILFRARQSRRAQIEEFFRTHLGQRFSTSDLHARFGSAFRTRVNEINRHPRFAITIHNETTVSKNDERSIYWAEPRKPGAEERESDYMRRVREEEARAMPLFARAGGRT